MLAALACTGHAQDNASSSGALHLCERMKGAKQLQACRVSSMRLCRCSGRAAEMQPFGTVYDPNWDLRAYSGWSPSMSAIIVAFRCAPGSDAVMGVAVSPHAVVCKPSLAWHGV